MTGGSILESDVIKAVLARHDIDNADLVDELWSVLDNVGGSFHNKLTGQEKQLFGRLAASLRKTAQKIDQLPGCSITHVYSDQLTELIDTAEVVSNGIECFLNSDDGGDPTAVQRLNRVIQVQLDLPRRQRANIVASILVETKRHWLPGTESKADEFGDFWESVRLQIPA